MVRGEDKEEHVLTLALNQHIHGHISGDMFCVKKTHYDGDDVWVRGYWVGEEQSEFNQCVYRRNRFLSKDDQVDAKESTLKPLTEWSNDLVGKRVVCQAEFPACPKIKKGEAYTIESAIRLGETISLKETGIGWCFGLRYFTLAPDQGDYTPRYNDRLDATCNCRCHVEDSKDVFKINGANLKYETLEETYTMVMEFPNTDHGPRIVEIPKPEGSGWLTETTVYDWPHIHINHSSIIDQWDVIHENGKIIYNEYEKRMFGENPRILSITRWMRTIPNPQSEPIDTYPNPLAPEPPPSKFWVENHKVVWKKGPSSSDTYPGADKRPPEKGWSGVWLEGHAPAIKAVY